MRERVSRMDRNAGRLKRRHSGAAVTDESEPGIPHQPSRGHHETDVRSTAALSGIPSNKRRRSTGGGRGRRTRKSVGSGIDYEGVEARDGDRESATSRDSSRHAPRVRFSTDVTTFSAQRARRPSRAGSGGNTGGLGPAAMTSSPGSAGMGEENVQSPGGIMSPSSITAQPQESSSPPSTPSPRGRARSLRRSLLSRNFSSPSSPPSTAASAARSTIIELSEVTSGTDFSPRPKPSFVTVSPKVERVPSNQSPAGYSDSKPTEKILQGISTLPHYESWALERARHNIYLKRIQASLDRLRKFVLRIHEIPSSKDGRHIMLDASRQKPLIDERTGRPFALNWIRSSRYSLWNFLPRQLLAQFSKLANFYFLVVSVIQMVPGLSTTGTYTTIAPLLFFVSISIGREGYDDLRRYRLDKEENNRETEVLHAYQPDGSTASPGSASPHWAKKKWQELEVGDIVKMERDSAAPADLVLLHSTGPNHIAYIETMALDGETNLKSKQAVPLVAKRCDGHESIASCRAEIVVEDPNIDLYNFEGRVTVGGETIPLTNNEIVYRGSVLRNTSEAVGLVVFTGEECKIRMNANKNPRTKAPALQNVVNKVVVVIVIFVILLAIFNTVAYQFWSLSRERKSWYLHRAKVAFVQILASFIIMFNTLIPLSLYVSLEIVKVCQMFLMNDIDMYDPVSNTPFEARTSTINEELGQVSYIFSDKTGTLTDNSMKFRKLSVAGTAWLHNVDLQDDGKSKEVLRHKKRKRKIKAKKSLASLADKAKKSGLITRADIDQDYCDDQSLSDEAEKVEENGDSHWMSSARPRNPKSELTTNEMIRYMQMKPHTVFARKARLFLISIALCHTCLPERKENGDIDFQASSPDELALVKAAQELGFLAMNRDDGTLTLKYASRAEYEGVTETYNILNVLEFSSRRKRMSIIVRFPDSRICILCKGADSLVMERLRYARLANQKVAEIEQRANQRKSMEAEIAMRRKSEQGDRPRSFSIGRPSIGGMSIDRPSTSHRLPIIRDVLDDWLRQREHDVEISPAGDNARFYSPRPSATLNRASLALSDGRSSMQLEDDEDLVEEGLVVDEPAVIERTFQHINDFASEGLRTLLYGYRFIDADEFDTWRKVYHDATTSLVDRQEKIEAAGELIEQQLDLAGATAIEDKLQVGVPESIDKLRRADIKLWMLTGDKRETAINIGHSCRLIKDYSSVVVLDHEAGEVEQNIATALVSLNGGGIAHSVIVVDGQTLALIEAEKSVRDIFYELAILADSVICCRASPSQKAGLVKAIRKRVKKSITLAIGDGANDIAMIQEAHVGIGITGKEGLQAARTSDYSIAQFRFLTKLLLVHGRWNYIRICKYTVGTFWKEFLFYITQALYQRWNGYTGTSLYESWSLSMFNTLFTSLPVIFMGTFEKDLQPATLLAVPELYTKGQRNGGFNFKIYMGWMFMAASEAMVVFFLMLSMFGMAAYVADNSLFAMGDMTFTACVVLISAKMQLLEVHNKSATVCVSIVCSVGGWLLWNIVLSRTYLNNRVYNVRDGFFHRFGRAWLWFLMLVLIVAACIVFEVVVASGRAGLFPTDVDVFQELERDPEVRKRFEEAAAMELQAGWDGGTERSSREVARMEREREQVTREGMVQEMLDNRPRGQVEDEVMGKAWDSRRGRTMGDRDGEHWLKRRRSSDLEGMLRRGFGTVRTRRES